MNIKFFERFFQGFEYNRTQALDREIEVANTKNKSLHVVEIRTTLIETTFNLPAYLAERQLLVERALSCSIAVV